MQLLVACKYPLVYSTLDILVLIWKEIDLFKYEFRQSIRFSINLLYSNVKVFRYQQLHLHLN
jgi:hypothetical protein